MSAFILSEHFLAKPAFTSKTLSLGDLSVLTAASVINLIVFFGGTTLFMPDSGNYILGAVSIANDGVFYINPIRTYGYSAFLAVFYALFGAGFLTWATAAQHLLLIITALAVKRLTYLLVTSHRIAVIAGLFSAFALQLISYANLPMSEVLFAFLCTLSIYFTVAYTGTATTKHLLLAVAAASAASLVRPSGLYFPIFIICLAAIRIAQSRNVFGFKASKPLIAAVFLYAAIVTPPMLQNLVNHGHFKLVGNLGQNLYSNTVEYGHFWDPDSAAIRDIKTRFEEWTAQKKARGESIPEGINWRNHWPATTAYLDMTGKTLWEGDAIFRQAATDAIAAHPGRFLFHLAMNVKTTILYTEPTYLYMPGYFDGEAEKPWYLPSALPLSWLDDARARISGVLDKRGDVEGNPVFFSEPTIVTPIYGLLSRIYHYLIRNFATPSALLALVGLLYASWRLYRTRDLTWLTILVAFAYYGMIPLLVVPGSPRHRLPVDPLLASLMAIGLLAIAKGGRRVLVELLANADGIPTNATSLQAKVEFLLHENRNLSATVRYLRATINADDPLARQTRASFDFQWQKLPTGRHNLEHPLFKDEAPGYVSEYTGFSPEWFKGKKVIDVGCGAGRYSYAMSVLGADVLSIDQSPHGLARAREACRNYPAHRSKEVNLLRPIEIDETFDLVWSYGVLHHTGDTYGAFRRIVPLVKPGGWIFLMLYGLPREDQVSDFDAVNEYERWRSEVRNMAFEEKLERLITASTDGTLRAQGIENVEGYFDAISPVINDLYSWTEIETWLVEAGFVDIKRTIDTRNHHLVARKPE